MHKNLLLVHKALLLCNESIAHVLQEGLRCGYTLLYMSGLRLKFSVYHSLPVSHTGIQRVIPYFLLVPVRIPLVPQKPVPPASFPFAFCNYISSMR